MSEDEAFVRSHARLLGIRLEVVEGYSPVRITQIILDAPVGYQFPSVTNPRLSMLLAVENNWADARQRILTLQKFEKARFV